MLLNQSTVVILLSVGMLSSLSLMVRVLVVLDVWINKRTSGLPEPGGLLLCIPQGLFSPLRLTAVREWSNPEQLL